MKNTISAFFTFISFVGFSQSVQLDSSYANNGLNKQEIVFGGDDQALLSAVQTDGKLLICGSTYSPAANNTYPFISRYLTNGILDTTFYSTGISILTSLPTCSPYSMVIQNDGKIVIAGQQFHQGKVRGIVIRFMSDGTLDTSFNATGYSRTTNTAHNYLGRSVSMQNSKIILAGYIEKSTSNSDFFAARFLSSGSIDNTFGTQGIVEKDFGGVDICRGVTVQPNNKIILSGFDQTNSSPNLFRLLENGNEDVSFNNNWSSSTKYPYSFPYQSIVLDDGKILNLGFSWDSLTSKINLYTILLKADGTKDPSFGSNGEFMFNLPGEDTYGIYGLQRDNGNLVIVGNSGNISAQQMSLFAMGIKIDGTIDSTFQDNGIYSSALSSNYDLLNAVHLGINKTIVATGYYNVASYTNKPVIVQFKIDEISHITSLDSPLNISIYPNPLNTDILQFENKSQTNLTIEIYNVTGGLVHQQIQANKATQVAIPLELLKKGMYFIRAISEGNQDIKTIPFIKN